MCIQKYVLTIFYKQQSSYEKQYKALIKKVMADMVRFKHITYGSKGYNNLKACTKNYVSCIHSIYYQKK